jgi:hypothetical protein
MVKPNGIVAKIPTTTVLHITNFEQTTMVLLERREDEMRR